VKGSEVVPRIDGRLIVEVSSNLLP
jgi:hypothetical protein